MAGFLFHGGPIYPMAAPRIDGGVLLTRDATIEWVGPGAELPAALAGGAARVDLAGRPLFPGFCDSHVHLVLSSDIHRGIDCRDAESSGDLCERVRAQANRTPPETWIVGAGWELEKVFTHAPPRLAALDAAAPHHPVFLTSRDLHSAWLSSRALERLDALAEPPPDYVVKQAELPTGLVQEGIFELRRRLLPRPSATGRIAALNAFVGHLHACGITTVHNNETPEELDLVARAWAEGGPRVRALWNVVLEDPGAVADVYAAPEPSGAWLQRGGVKLFLDGSFGSLTAALSEPYTGTEDHGILNLDDSELDRWLAAVRNAGTHGVFHAIGDRALDQILRRVDAVEWPPGTRHRVEHAQLLSAAAIERGCGDLIFSGQPSHMPGDRDIVARHLPPALAARSYAFASMQRAGGLVVFGSDSPVQEIDPWKGIQAAVTRLGSDAWLPSETVSLTDAIRCHTSHPARLHHQLRSGVLERGAAADLVVFNRDPFALDAENLDGAIAADLTFVGGELAFERKGAAPSCD